MFRIVQKLLLDVRNGLKREHSNTGGSHSSGLGAGARRELSVDAVCAGQYGAKGRFKVNRKNWLKLRSRFDMGGPDLWGDRGVRSGPCSLGESSTTVPMSPRGARQSCANH
jgi:hypothetical protein